jgi:uncharacterized hydrophobic protein (TIGR00271 family)
MPSVDLSPLQLYYRRLKQTLSLYSSLISDQDLQRLHGNMSSVGGLSLNYLVLTFGAAGIATVGLIADSATIIIGAMIIAPLMGSIQGLTLGILMGEQQLIKRGLLALLTGALLGVTSAALIGTLLTIPTYGSEILARTRPNNLDLIVALLAGMSATETATPARLSATLGRAFAKGPTMPANRATSKSKLLGRVKARISLP